MNETEQEYPADWDLAEKGEEMASENLKIKGGQKVRVRIVQGPKAFSNFWVEKFPVLDKKTEKTDYKKRSFNVPFGAQIPGQKMKQQYLFEVVLLEGASAGIHKLWIANQDMVNQLSEFKKDWGGIHNFDLTIRREGEGQYDTEWYLSVAPKSNPEGVSYTPVFELAKKIYYAKAEDLAKIPPVVVEAPQPSELRKGASPAQVGRLENVCAQKGLSVAEAMKLGQYDKKGFSELSTTEASRLIDLVQNA